VNPRRRAILFMCAHAALWALTESIAVGVLTRYSAYQVVFTRYAVQLALMFVVWGFRAPHSLVRTRRPVFQLARSLLMVGMPASFVLSAARGIDMRTLNSVLWLSPFLVFGLSSSLLKERPSVGAWGASVLAYGALFLFTGVPSLVPVSALFFAFCMAAAFSVYVVMTRSLRSEPIRANLFYTALGVVLCLSPFVPGLWVTPSLVDMLVMATVGLLGFLTLYALHRATEIAPASVSVPFLFVQLPASTAIARHLGYAQFGVLGLIATAILALCGLYLWLREADLAREMG
jgi:drug/metabolite transporter (DMT)-like permease